MVRKTWIYSYFTQPSRIEYWKGSFFSQRVHARSCKYLQNLLGLVIDFPSHLKHEGNEGLLVTIYHFM